MVTTTLLPSNPNDRTRPTVTNNTSISNTSSTSNATAATPTTTATPVVVTPTTVLPPIRLADIAYTHPEAMFFESVMGLLNVFNLNAVLNPDQHLDVDAALLLVPDVTSDVTTVSGVGTGITTTSNSTWVVDPNDTCKIFNTTHGINKTQVTKYNVGDESYQGIQLFGQNIGYYFTWSTKSAISGSILGLAIQFGVSVFTGLDMSNAASVATGVLIVTAGPMFIDTVDVSQWAYQVYVDRSPSKNQLAVAAGAVASTALVGIYSYGIYTEGLVFLGPTMLGIIDTTQTMFNGGLKMVVMYCNFERASTHLNKAGSLVATGGTLAYRTGRNVATFVWELPVVSTVTGVTGSAGTVIGNVASTTVKAVGSVSQFAQSDVGTFLAKSTVFEYFVNKAEGYVKNNVMPAYIGAVVMLLAVAVGVTYGLSRGIQKRVTAKRPSAQSKPTKKSKRAKK